MTTKLSRSEVESIVLKTLDWFKHELNKEALRNMTSQDVYNASVGIWKEIKEEEEMFK